MREMQVDEKTRDYIRNWGRSEVPTAQVTGGKVNPGTYRALATLGFVERRGPAAICCVHFLVLQNQAYTPMATLSLAMPVTKKTELHVNSFLHVLGWDGRVWPYDFDGGWPDNETSYTFLGSIFEGKTYRPGRKSPVSPTAPSAQAFAWAWSFMARGEMPPSCEVWHEGRCGRCGRSLTVPESVASGIGPVCESREAV
jgi:hypothetical protein